MNGYIESNRELWNGWTRLHEKSEFYRLKEFRAGANVLKEVEQEEVGDVRGKTLLHLQCHFGLDTLSWARKGAIVTGADISDDAIALAQSLRRELSIPGRFIRANLYDLPKVLDEQFDIVFTSYGALCWLPDLPEWGRIAARYVKPGGFFYIVEFHPIMTNLDEAGNQFELPYFSGKEPYRFESQGSYAGTAPFEHVTYEWTFGIGDVVSALASAGLRIEYLHEFPFCIDGGFKFLEETQPGRFMLRGRPNMFPLMFSIKASKER